MSYSSVHRITHFLYVFMIFVGNYPVNIYIYINFVCLDSGKINVRIILFGLVTASRARLVIF
jgi:hypothetical protein